jgi:hypothetical protein
MYPHLISDLRGLRNFCADRAMKNRVSQETDLLVWEAYTKASDAIIKGMDKRTDEEIVQEAVKQVQNLTY